MQQPFRGHPGLDAICNQKSTSLNKPADLRDEAIEGGVMLEARGIRYQKPCRIKL